MPILVRAGEFPGWNIPDNLARMEQVKQHFLLMENVPVPPPAQQGSALAELRAEPKAAPL